MGDSSFPAAPSERARRLEREVEEGHVEYKLHLLHPEDRFQGLVTQLLWRCREGGGYCVYNIGVRDDGMPVGQTAKVIDDSLHTLRAMAAAASATILSEIRRVALEDSTLQVAEVHIKRPFLLSPNSTVASPHPSSRSTLSETSGTRETAGVSLHPTTSSSHNVYPSNSSWSNSSSPASILSSTLNCQILPEKALISTLPTNSGVGSGGGGGAAACSSHPEVTIAVLGGKGSGKSTWIAVTTFGVRDDGNGSARYRVFKHRHEIEDGRTSSVGRHLFGVDGAGKPVTNAASGGLSMSLGAPEAANFPGSSNSSSSSNRINDAPETLTPSPRGSNEEALRSAPLLQQSPNSSYEKANDPMGGGDLLSSGLSQHDIIAASKRLVTLLDLAGDAKYAKTAIQGFLGARPDYAQICIPADYAVKARRAAQAATAIALSTSSGNSASASSPCPAASPFAVVSSASSPSSSSAAATAAAAAAAAAAALYLTTTATRVESATATRVESTFPTGGEPASKVADDDDTKGTSTADASNIEVYNSPSLKSMNASQAVPSMIAPISLDFSSCSANTSSSSSSSSGKTPYAQGANFWGASKDMSASIPSSPRLQSASASLSMAVCVGAVGKLQDIAMPLASASQATKSSSGGRRSQQSPTAAALHHRSSVAGGSSAMVGGGVGASPTAAAGGAPFSHSTRRRVRTHSSNNLLLEATETSADLLSSLSFHAKAAAAASSSTPAPLELDDVTCSHILLANSLSVPIYFTLTKADVQPDAGEAGLKETLGLIETFVKRYLVPLASTAAPSAAVQNGLSPSDATKSPAPLQSAAGVMAVQQQQQPPPEASTAASPALLEVVHSRERAKEIAQRHGDVQAKKQRQQQQQQQQPWPIPVFVISNVTGRGLDVLSSFVCNLHPMHEWSAYEGLSPEFTIDEVWCVGGRTIVAGLVLAGTITVGQLLLLGPDATGHFQTIRVANAQNKRVPVEMLPAGSSATLQLTCPEGDGRRPFPKELVRKGQVLLQLPASLAHESDVPAAVASSSPMPFSSSAASSLGRPFALTASTRLPPSTTTIPYVGDIILTAGSGYGSGKQPYLKDGATSTASVASVARGLSCGVSMTATSLEAIVTFCKPNYCTFHEGHSVVVHCASIRQAARITAIQKVTRSATAPRLTPGGTLRTTTEEEGTASSASASPSPPVSSVSAKDALGGVSSVSSVSAKDAFGGVSPSSPPSEGPIEMSLSSFPEPALPLKGGTGESVNATARISLRFSNPEYLRQGASIILRDGLSLAAGHIVRIVEDAIRSVSAPQPSRRRHAFGDGSDAASNATGSTSASSSSSSHLQASRGGNARRGSGGGRSRAGSEPPLQGQALGVRAEVARVAASLHPTPTLGASAVTVSAAVAGLKASPKPRHGKKPKPPANYDYANDDDDDDDDGMDLGIAAGF